MSWRKYANYILWTLLLLVFGCRSEVLEDLAESEANEIIVRLAQTGVDGEKVRSGSGQSARYSVTVPRGDMAKAVQSLKAVGLPRAQHEGFRSVYKDRALVPGKFEQQAMFLSALQEELSKTLESVQGVLWSRVHVTLKAKTYTKGLAKPKSIQVQSASVLLGYLKRAGTKPPLSQEQVQNLVANAVEGLEPADVAVVFSAEEQSKSISSTTALQAADPGILRWALFALAVFCLAVAAVVAGRRFGLWPGKRGASP